MDAWMHDHRHDLVQARLRDQPWRVAVGQPAHAVEGAGMPR
jgi:hypothetical protein